MPRKFRKFYRKKLRRSFKRKSHPVRLYKQPMKDVVCRFRDVSASLSFAYAGTTTFYQPFRIGPAGTRLTPDMDQRNFTSLYSSLNYMANVYERYKISGCKLTCTITRTQSDDGKIPNDVPVCFETIDEMGSWYDRATQTWIPTFGNNGFGGTELINDNRVRMHTLHNNVSTFSRWIPFTECAARTSQYTVIGGVARDYASGMSVEPIIRKPQWHWAWSPVDPLNANNSDYSRYNHGVPFWWMILVNASNAQTLKINFEYSFYVHFDDSNFAPQLQRTAAAESAVPQMGTAGDAGQPDLPAPAPMDPRHVQQIHKALRKGGDIQHYGEAPFPQVVKHVEPRANQVQSVRIPDSAYVVEDDDEVYEEKDDDGYNMDDTLTEKHHHQWHNQPFHSSFLPSPPLRWQGSLMMKLMVPLIPMAPR